MRKFLAGLVSVTLLSFAAAPASATTSHDDLINWTETWVAFDQEFFIQEFVFDQDSEFDLIDADPEIDATFVTTIGGSAIGAIVEITIPNFFDPLPMKRVHVVFEGQNGGAAGFGLPRVLSIIGGDSDFFDPGPALPVFGELESQSCVPTKCEEHWVMYPNPDFETVKVFIPLEFEFESMHIITQSLRIPEPGTMTLLGSGLFGLIMAGRRRQ